MERIHDLERTEARHFIHLRLDGYPFHEILEAQATSHLRHDGVGVRVPGCDERPAVDLVAVAHLQARAVGHLVSFALAPDIVEHVNLTGA